MYVNEANCATAISTADAPNAASAGSDGSRQKPRTRSAVTSRAGT